MYLIKLYNIKLKKRECICGTMKAKRCATDKVFKELIG